MLGTAPSVGDVRYGNRKLSTRRIRWTGSERKVVSLYLTQAEVYIRFLHTRELHRGTSRQKMRSTFDFSPKNSVWRSFAAKIFPQPNNFTAKLARPVRRHTGSKTPPLADRCRLVVVPLASIHRRAHTSHPVVSVHRILRRVRPSPRLNKSQSLRGAALARGASSEPATPWAAR